MTSPTSFDHTWTRLAVYALAIVVPSLFAFSGWQPSPTLLNELLAVGGWGLCLALHQGMPPSGARRYAIVALGAALAVMAAAVVGSWTLGSLPTSLALPPLSLLVIACVVASLGARVAQEAATEGLPAFAPFAIAMVTAGVLSAAIAVVQVFWPDLPDGNLIARSGLVGRAVGNLRQPNHLASLLVWAMIALVPIVEWRRLPRWLGGLIGALLIFGVVLSGSRTGLYGGAAVLALWGVVDRRLAPSTRTFLVGTLLVAGGVFAWGVAAQHLGGHTVGAASRASEGDTGHLAIWKNALEMIRQQPLLGVGWGEFNFAWTLTPFPNRPTAFFDHTHDLPLQLAVELGIPCALVVLGLLFWSLGQGLVRAWAAEGDAGHGARAAWVMILMIAVHSLDEYPLWYAYFLLPAAWAWGFTLGSGPAPRPDALSGVGSGAGRGVDSGTTLIRLSSEGVALRWIGALMMLVAAIATWDYYRVSTIFSDREGLDPLAERISAGESSPLFAHHADYADATTAEPPSRALSALERATHSLLDTRLMIAWATALSESGQPDRARYLVARLREFHKEKEEAAEFFAPCDDATIVDKPFQCQAEPKGLNWRDFR